MKDYSFGNKEYQKEFILNYGFSENDNFIILYLANGKTELLENSYENFEHIIERMMKQINVAEQTVDDFQHMTIQFNLRSILNFIKLYLTIKPKIRDLEKNKLFFKYIDKINKALSTSRRDWIFQLPLYLQTPLIFHIIRLDYKDSNIFSLKEIKQILCAIRHYSEIVLEDTRLNDPQNPPSTRRNRTNR